MADALQSILAKWQKWQAGDAPYADYAEDAIDEMLFVRDDPSLQTDLLAFLVEQLVEARATVGKRDRWPTRTLDRVVGCTVNMASAGTGVETMVTSTPRRVMRALLPRI